MVERLKDSNYALVVPMQTYTILKSGSSWVNFGIHNLSARTIQVQSKTAMEKFSATNSVPDMLAPHATKEIHTEEGDKILPPLPEDKQTKLLEKVDLSGTESWTSEQKDQVQQLFFEFGGLFILDSLDLGKTSRVKHNIRLNDYTLFKERYCRISPHLYEEVKKHLREMMDIGPIRKSSSPWASVVVLV